jgi:2'-5' RNA ligase
MPPSDDSLQARYDDMWSTAWPAVSSGDIAVDERLSQGPDRRRGLTLIARPQPPLAQAFAAMLADLLACEPAQYVHPVADMHVTILSLFTATEHYAPQLERLADYRAVVADAVRDAGPFAIDFTGITMSRGAVVAQGTPQGPALEALRDRLRDGLRAHGLDGTLDQRYKLVTAHSTLLRFAAPLRDPARFVQALQAYREQPFGTMQVAAVELVFNDWYMSAGTLELIDRHVLPG